MGIGGTASETTKSPNVDVSKKDTTFSTSSAFPEPKNSTITAIMKNKGNIKKVLPNVEWNPIETAWVEKQQ
jgi:hypothetical protein